MPTEVIKTGYEPRPLQGQLHKDLIRYNVLVAHRRFGKTVFCINELIDRALFNKLPDPRYAYIAPFFNQAKDVAWEYLKRYTRPIPGSQPNESELRVDLPNKARVRLYGADNPDRLRGLYLDGVVLDEYGQMNPTIWPEIIRPMLVDRQGWAIFMGTPFGRNHFAEMFDEHFQDPDWLVKRFRASETEIINPVELHNARKTMTEDQYNREFQCSFDAAIPGAYYARLIQQAEDDNRVTRVPYDPGYPVDTAWDLGMDDMTAIWFFQEIGLSLHVIDYYENNNEEPPHYAGVIRAKPYKSYGCHYLPHDGGNRGVLSKNTYEDQLRSQEIGRINVGIKRPPLERVNAVRKLLPKCVFDRQKTLKGVEALRMYHTEYDDDKKTFKETPLHDWSSHAADAFGEYAVSKTPKAKTKSPTDYKFRKLA